MSRASGLAALLLVLLVQGCGSSVRPIVDQSACVSGFVTRDGQPAPGAEVRASTGEATLAGAEGQYSLRLPPDTTVTLRVRASESDSFFFADSVLVLTGQPKSACARQDFQLGATGPGVVCVQGVVALEFEPVAGARVTAGAGRVATSDAHGRYLFRLGPGETVTLHATAQIGAGRYRATRTFAAPASAAPPCPAPELLLAPEGIPFHVEAVLESHIAPTGELVSSVRCWAWNETRGEPLEHARITVTPQEGVPLEFTASPLPGEYFATGALTPGDPPLPTADPGYKYHLSVDVEGDGLEDAATDVDGPPTCAVADPRSNAVRPAIFTAYWRGRPRPDSAVYSAGLRDLATGAELTTRPGAGLRFASFCQVPPGAYSVRVHATRGRANSQARVNLLGAEVFGHFWSEFTTSGVTLTVISGNGP